MKKIMRKIMIAVLLFSVAKADAQIAKLSGPRVGITMVTPGSLASILRKDVGMFSDEIRDVWTGSTGKYGAVMSQYGWQWESRFADGEKVVGIVEWIALVGAVEKGMFLPSVSSLVGFRTEKGLELAVGPNLSLGGVAMVIGAGYNFKIGEMNVPVNIAYVPSMDKTYHHEEVYIYDENITDPDGIPENGDEYYGYTITPSYDVVHPTGARLSVMVGFNLYR